MNKKLHDVLLSVYFLCFFAILIFNENKWIPFQLILSSTDM